MTCLSIGLLKKAGLLHAAASSGHDCLHPSAEAAEQDMLSKAAVGHDGRDTPPVRTSPGCPFSGRLRGTELMTCMM